MNLFRASWVLPVDKPPIKNGIVAVKNGRIVAVESLHSPSFSEVCGEDYREEEILDLGEGALIPGLVNAHTHLEFSFLDRPLGSLGIRFTDWIRLIMECRAGDKDDQRKPRAIANGIEQSFQAGVWLIGDIVTDPINLDSYRNLETPVALTLFRETLGRDSQQFDKKQQQMASFLSQSRADADNSDLLFAASPHAPYSVHPELLRKICDTSKINFHPVAMHVSETREENDLLEHQAGDFVALLKDLGVWDPDSFLPVCSVLEILETLSSVPRSLVIHGNYLSPEQLDLIATKRARMSIVFCPRTHLFFDHAPYPLHEMLDRKIEVALGTDSCASNPNLDLFEDMKQVARLFPDLPAIEILKMGTIRGATALGRDQDFGTITVGKKSALSFVSRPTNVLSGRTADSEDFDWLFSKEATCVPLLGQSKGV